MIEMRLPQVRNLPHMTAGAVTLRRVGSALREQYAEVVAAPLPPKLADMVRRLDPPAARTVEHRPN